MTEVRRQAAVRTPSRAASAGAGIAVTAPGSRIRRAAAFRLPVVAAGALLTACSGPSQAAPRGDDALEFSIREGQILNRFFRRGPVAAHLVLKSGVRPRLLVAFPAGNSGVGLWFRPAPSAVDWRTAGALRPLRVRNPDGEPLFGIEAGITAGARELVVERAVLGSVRVLRDYRHGRELPDAVRSEPAVSGRTVTWYRDRLDGRGGYRLTVEVLEGSLSAGPGRPLAFRAPDGGKLRLRVRALSGDEPLTPIPADELLLPQANADPLARGVLAFLSYEEKLLAGSWRFLTYFGRDTLMSVALLMPVLRPAAIEAGIGSVLARVNAGGEVAHEEEIGEFAALRRGGAGAGPRYDYRMIDDDFMLAPVAARYLLDRPEGRRRAAAFLAQPAADGRTNGEALARNLGFVIDAARPFARAPDVERLIRLQEGAHAGQWRDSREGLGFGRIPYDVNAVFVPAALRAIARLHASGLLGDYPTAGQDLAEALSLARTWEAAAPPCFRVQLPGALARRRVVDYADRLGIPHAQALASLPSEKTGEKAGETAAGELTFNAVALDADGRPVPVLHSDDGFAWLFGTPQPQDLERSVAALLRPFPAGLLTPVGLLVANPAYAGADLRRLFTPGHYHGTVVWSWHQAVAAAGLERQLQRDDLPAGTRRRLGEARKRLWRAIAAGDEVRTSELWSWSFRDGRYRVEPFGQRAGDETESNAAQLWSTVYLALSPP